MAPVEHSSVLLDLDLGGDASLGSTIGPAAILSPEGARLVFVSRGQDGKPRLFTRRLNQPKAALLAKTDGAYGPFFHIHGSDGEHSQR